MWQQLSRGPGTLAGGVIRCHGRQDSGSELAGENAGVGGSLAGRGGEGRVGDQGPWGIAKADKVGAGSGWKKSSVDGSIVDRSKPDSRGLVSVYLGRPSPPGGCSLPLGTDPTEHQNSLETGKCIPGRGLCRTPRKGRSGLSTCHLAARPSLGPQSRPFPWVKDCLGEVANKKKTFFQESKGD